MSCVEILLVHVFSLIAQIEILSVHSPKQASDIPPFSSQQSEAPSLQEDTPVQRRERRKWTPADDEVIISVWLNTSKDTIVGIGDDRIVLDGEGQGKTKPPTRTTLLFPCRLGIIPAVHYPPQPEVEFGIPQICYCGRQPLVASSHSRNHPGRLYYTCANVDDGDCHVWKWWDVAVMEEMKARDLHTLELAQKVDSLTLMGDYVTEQKVAKLEEMVSKLSNKNPVFTNRFEMVVAFMVVV
ncbi:hypothetical protein DY000_02033234 [Brassica cretica]|uniref:GRF-type domain-containing protein n=1 Tax=Brassica cretica TaxID=69181 RepID=A0ABQ7DK62_BRACR|nr:hypothetical protein DY000_02033234 [Brassica cretica]